MTVVSSSRGSKGNDPDHVVMRRADGSPIHVLVVDDEPVLAELVSMALRYEGWTIVHVRRRRIGDRGGRRSHPTWWCST